MSYETVLSDIDRAVGARRRASFLSREDRALAAAEWRAQETAIRAFAAINGWTADFQGYCHPEAIGHSKRRFLDVYVFPDFLWAVETFDHCLNFRANGKNAAVVAQPYNYKDPPKQNNGPPNATSPSFSPQTNAPASTSPAQHTSSSSPKPAAPSNGSPNRTDA
jgi:hypothetical protein